MSDVIYLAVPITVSICGLILTFLFSRALASSRGENRGKMAIILVLCYLALPYIVAALAYAIASRMGMHPVALAYQIFFGMQMAYMIAVSVLLVNLIWYLAFRRRQ